MAPPALLKNVLPRSEIPAGDCLCDHCAGKCCRYFSLPMETPHAWGDYDAIRRHLAHGQTLVYVEKGTWYLVVMTRCGYLTEEDRCQIYWSRPKICHDYTTAECEYDDDWLFEKVFETPEQLTEYAEAILPPRRSQPPEPASTGTTSLPFETPDVWDDYDAIRWYLAHGQTLVYVAKGIWHLLVMSPGSTHDDRPFDQMFETPEQLWEYAEAILPPRRVKRREPALTVITPL